MARSRRLGTCKSASALKQSAEIFVRKLGNGPAGTNLHHPKYTMCLMNCYRCIVVSKSKTCYEGGQSWMLLATPSVDGSSISPRSSQLCTIVQCYARQLTTISFDPSLSQSPDEAHPAGVCWKYQASSSKLRRRLLWHSTILPASTDITFEPHRQAASVSTPLFQLTHSLKHLAHQRRYQPGSPTYHPRHHHDVDEFTRQAYIGVLREPRRQCFHRDRRQSRQSEASQALRQS